MSKRERAVALLCTYEEIRYMGHMGLDIPNICTQCRFGFITQLHCYIHLHSFYLRAPSACDKKILERMPQSILTSSHCIITPEKKDNAIILLP